MQDGAACRFRGCTFCGTAEHNGLCSEHAHVIEADLQQHNLSYKPPREKRCRCRAPSCDCRVCLLPCMLCCPDVLCSVM